MINNDFQNVVVKIAGWSRPRRMTYSRMSISLEVQRNYGCGCETCEEREVFLKKCLSGTGVGHFWKWGWLVMENKRVNSAKEEVLLGLKEVLDLDVEFLEEDANLRNKV